MSRRSSAFWMASALLLACGDDASTTGSGSSDSGEGSSSTGPAVTLDDTSAGSTSMPATSDASSDASSDDTTTVDPSTTGSTTTDAESSSTGPEVTCGNGVIEGDEVCDGTELGGESCMSQGLDGGELACQGDCMGFDTRGCAVAACGDDLAEGDELCDGTDLLGESCATQGFDSGTLACAPDCTGFATEGCGTCGNAIIDGDEACDGVALPPETCITQGFEYGELACAADCQGLVTAGCGLCGDGSVGGAEACDGADLAGESCTSFGFDAGNLACQLDCTFDESDCQMLTELVDFPIAADPRFTASGNRPWNAGDWFEGVRNTSIASTDQIDIHLEIGANSLSPCGVQEAEVSINGVALGTFAVLQGTTVIDQSFPVVPSIVGPVYTIRYETTATVAGGCGSAEYDEIGSTVTFHQG